MSEHEESAGAPDLVAVIVGVIGSAVLGIAAATMALFLVMASDGCGEDCSTETIAAGVGFGVVAPVVAWILGVIWVIVRRRRDKKAWWVPVLVILSYVPLLGIAAAIVFAGASA